MRTRTNVRTRLVNLRSVLGFINMMSQYLELPQRVPVLVASFQHGSPPHYYPPHYYHHPKGVKVRAVTDLRRVPYRRRVFPKG